MTKKKEKQLLCEDNLRHNEYYGMQSTIDNLYQASANGEVFTDLMSVILQREIFCLRTEISRRIQEVRQAEQTTSQSRTSENVPPMKWSKK